VRSLRLRVGIAILGFVAIASGVVLARAWRARAAHKPLPALAGEVELIVPHVEGSISLDGDLDDSGWLGPIAHTGAFVDKNGVAARPYSEARLTWGDGVLYLSFYAADEDIRASVTEANGPLWRDDSFHFVFDDGKNERIFDASVNAVMSSSTRSSTAVANGGGRDVPWQSGAFVSRELDGTLNDASDDDEEWALEIAVPLESIGLRGEVGERVRFAAHRCDLPKNGKRVCASFGERAPVVLVLQ
jgi:hypothetical protein